MNFANVKTLAIPEGNVKQIEDAQGNVLWKKANEPFKFTSTNYGSITNNGNNYSLSQSAVHERTTQINFNNAVNNQIYIYYKFEQVGTAYIGSSWYIKLHDQSGNITNLYNGSSSTSGIHASFYIPQGVTSGYIEIYTNGGSSYNWSPLNMGCTVNMSTSYV